jgi:dTDP-4-dehydrorhamnose 3,5-epimerase
MSGLLFPGLETGAHRREDSRGHLAVLYEQGDLVLKRSFSRAGVFRGMHWQGPPSPQTKLIRVVRGRIQDFIVDPLAAAPHLFHKQLGPEHGWVRIGAEWAHGFYALSDCEFEYICHGAYDEAAEQAWSIAPFVRDELGIEDAIYSAKDAAARPLAVADATCLD